MADFGPWRKFINPGLKENFALQNLNGIEWNVQVLGVLLST
jgi:hypothetical protein